MNYWKKLVEFLAGSEDGSGERARNTKGHFKADDKKTASVNEAYKDGKTPKSKAKKTAPKKNGRGRPKGSKNKVTK
jgi:hypothetical protein